MTSFILTVLKLLIQLLIVFVIGSVAMMSTLFVTEFIITIKSRLRLKRLQQRQITKT